jgi:peptide/nickel transport system substrate-binding protein
VRFADGVELRSDDVAFTYRAILDPRNSVLSSDAYRRIRTLRTPDPYTVVVTLARRWNAAVSDLFSQSDFAFGILPAHAFHDTQLRHAAWEEHAFGTGPFRVMHWYRGDRIILTPNPYFSPRPRLARVELRMIPDGNTAFVALRTHEVDVAALTTPQMIDQARATRGIRVVRTQENGTEWISVQTLSGPGSQLRFRRAVAAALNPGELHKLYAPYDIAGSFLAPVMSPWYIPLASHPHDAAAARRLLRGATIDGTLVITAENPMWSRIATAVQQQLGISGIHVTIKKYPTSLFNAPDGPIRNARFTLSIDGWLGGADPEQSIVFTCAQATPNGDNISRYCDARFERAFAQQATTAHVAQRRADFAQMQRLVGEAIPVVPLYYLAWYDAAGTQVHGFARNMLQYPVNAENWDTY